MWNPRRHQCSQAGRPHQRIWCKCLPSHRARREPGATRAADQPAGQATGRRRFSGQQRHAYQSCAWLLVGLSCGACLQVSESSGTRTSSSIAKRGSFRERSGGRMRVYRGRAARKAPGSCRCESASASCAAEVDQNTVCIYVIYDSVCVATRVRGVWAKGYSLTGRTARRFRAAFLRPY